ncbi:hypothetical protein N431DRAFT_460482 [Stipitochalara longipes BDJ]|nr:hypothetical protein N431DRAFT_460482 [Stipitochalara longipes BDJ]
MLPFALVILPSLTSQNTEFLNIWSIFLFMLDSYSTFFFALASPVAVLATAGASSCVTEDLASATWITLGIDAFLKNWSAENVIVKSANNIESLAASFGDPNSFCGLDDFCNAGQPCLPITLPAWYAMVAIQNWNNYIKSLNSAITFASSIIDLTPPGIVGDFYPDPSDNTTPLQTTEKAFTTVLGLVSFIETFSTAVTVFS